MVNLEAHTTNNQDTRLSIKKAAYPCKWTTIQYIRIKPPNLKPFELNRCHRHRRQKKKRKKQRVKQFSKQLLMLAKLRAYAFTSSNTFVCVNNTVCLGQQTPEFPDALLIIENKSFV